MTMAGTEFGASRGSSYVSFFVPEQVGHGKDVSMEDLAGSAPRWPDGPYAVGAICGSTAAGLTATAMAVMKPFG